MPNDSYLITDYVMARYLWQVEFAIATIGWTFCTVLCGSSACVFASNVQLVSNLTSSSIAFFSSNQYASIAPPLHDDTFRSAIFLETSAGSSEYYGRRNSDV